MRYVLIALLWTAPAYASAPYKRDARLLRCMVYLPNLKNDKLRAWCFKQSERMP